MHPAAPSKVAGIATSQMLLSEMTRAEVRAMSDGQIGGLNGLVLAAAADQGIDGMCLLAEIPYFAAQVPSPKAARAALSVFSVLAGIDVRLEALDRHAEQYDRMLTEAYEQMKAHEGRGQQADDSAPEKESASQQAEGEDAGSGEGSRTAPPALSDEARARIEGLFEEARRDSSRAVALKQELDRLGVFRQFENRFLDLFRRAG